MNQAGIDICEQVWIPALESGEYAQGYGALRTLEDTYCCLGVLCNELDPKAWTKHGDGWGWEEKGQGYSIYGTLPFCVIDRFGFSGAFVAYLARLNDGDKASFSVIASAIKAEAATSKKALLAK